MYLVGLSSGRIVIQTLESVQRRSARFVFNDYSPYDSVSNMLTNLGWSPLADRQNPTLNRKVLPFVVSDDFHTD